MSMSGSRPSPMDVELGLKVKTQSHDEPTKPGGRGGEVEEEEVSEEPLSPAARILHSPSMDSYIMAVIGCKMIIDVDVVKEGLKHTLMKHPRFCSKLNGEKIGWVRTKVNIEDHIIVPDLDPDHMECSPDLFVEDYVSNQTKVPMDLSKPLWQVHILNVKTSDADAVAILKVHHSLGDGMSLMSLVLACTRKSSNPQELPSLPGAKRIGSKAPSHSDRVWRSCLVAIWSLIKLIWYTLIHFGHFSATACFLRDTETPIKGGPGVERTGKRIVHRLVSLDDIKLVKNEMDMTINDVIVGIANAALSRYLHRKYNGEQGFLGKRSDRLMKHIRLRASVIVNIRQSVGIQRLADMMNMEKGSKCKWGNKIGYILVPFHVALEMDLLDYVRKAKAIIDEKKQSLEAKLSYYFTLLVLNTMGIKAAAALAYRVLSNATLMISNMVGPAEQVSFYGHQAAYFAPTVYGIPVALLIHFQSYADQMCIVICADQDLISDPHELCDDMEESLEWMKNAVLDRKNILLMRTSTP